MKKILAFLLFLFVVMCLGVGVQAHNITNFTNRVLWENALLHYTILTENFEDTVLIPGFSITEVGGSGSIHNGEYENWVDGTHRYQIFTYAPGMIAFGAWLNLYDPGGPGTSIDIFINDDNTYVTNIPNTSNGDFYGFIADGSFTGVRFQEGNNGLSGIETYYNVDTSVVPTPEPSLMLLLGLGLLGTGFFVRRK